MRADRTSNQRYAEASIWINSLGASANKAKPKSESRPRASAKIVARVRRSWHCLAHGRAVGTEPDKKPVQLTADQVRHRRCVTEPQPLAPRAPSKTTGQFK